MCKGPVTEESTASMKTWKKTRVGRAERAKGVWDETAGSVRRADPVES